MSPGPLGRLKRLAGRRGALVALACAVLLVVLVVVLAGSGGRSHRRSSSAASPPAGRPPAAVPASENALPPRVAALARRMTPAQQVAQLFLVDFAGPRPPRAFLAALRGHGWGAVLFTRQNYVDPGQSGALVAGLARIARARRPVAPLLAATQDGSPSTAFPYLPPRSQPRTASRLRVADGTVQARAAGRELKRRGIALNLAPQADLDVPSGAVSRETFSPTPSIVTSFTSAELRGYLRAGVVPAIGHFPGQGAVSEDPDLRPGTVGLALQDLRRRDEAPFAAVAARAPAFVVSNASYAAFDGVTPATLSPAAINELRGRVGFRGAVISDDLTAAVLATGTGIGEAAVQSLRAGTDVVYVSGGAAVQESAYRAVLAAVRQGQIPAARLRDAVAHALALKVRAGVLRGVVSR